MNTKETLNDIFLVDNRGKTGSRACFPEKMSHYSDAQDIELVTAVASAAFAIHSNEEPKLQYRKGTRESIPIPRTKSLQDMRTGRPNKETRNNGT